MDISSLREAQRHVIKAYTNPIFYNALDTNDLDGLRRFIANETWMNQYLRKPIDKLSNEGLNKVIQCVKDEVQLIAAAIETSLDTETAIERLSLARADLFACYEKELAKFDDSESKACHQAKNRTLGIESFLRECLSQKSYASQLSGDERRRLLEFRDDLTDCQQRLRDSRADRLIGRMRNG